ncbi:hypothetical protein KEM54_000040 [Ascosphaera aggregata]|nr:hypothetical protein KEM54_000040 [Ascosphaera aggregata]
MVKIISSRRPRRYIHLPDEILEIIIAFVSDSQRTLRSCTLVSRRWYYISMPLLYCQPRALEKSEAFQQFVRTILGILSPTSSSVALRRRRIGLARLVEILDLSGLIHHSTSSRTAQLINAVKNRLRAFAAPSLSLTYGFMASPRFVTLSRCTSLEFLNLAYMMKAIDFPSVKKAIRRMSRLTGLVLPTGVVIQGDQDLALDIEWPPQLSYLSVGISLLLDPERRMEAGFVWPQKLRHLILTGYTDPLWMEEFVALTAPFQPFPNVEVLEFLPLRRPSLRARNLEAPVETMGNAIGAWAVVRNFPNLKSLTMASDQCDEDFMSAYCHCESGRLEQLRLLSSEVGIQFSQETMSAAAIRGLRGLRGFWYEVTEGVNRKILKRYDEAFCDAIMDRYPDDPLPDVGWFTAVDVPYDAREFEYQTWDGLCYTSRI